MKNFSSETAQTPKNKSVNNEVIENTENAKQSQFNMYYEKVNQAFEIQSLIQLSKIAEGQDENRVIQQEQENWSQESETYQSENQQWEARIKQDSQYKIGSDEEEDEIIQISSMMSLIKKIDRSDSAENVRQNDQNSEITQFKQVSKQRINQIFIKYRKQFQNKRYSYLNLKDKNVFKKFAQIIINKKRLADIQAQFQKMAKQNLQQNKNTIWKRFDIEKIFNQIFRMLRKEQIIENPNSQLYEKIVKSIKVKNLSKRSADKRKIQKQRKRKRKRQRQRQSQSQWRPRKSYNKYRLEPKQDFFVNLICMAQWGSLLSHEYKDLILYVKWEFRNIMDFLLQYFKHIISFFCLSFKLMELQQSLQNQLQTKIQLLKKAGDEILSFTLRGKTRNDLFNYFRANGGRKLYYKFEYSFEKSIFHMVKYAETHKFSTQ